MQNHFTISFQGRRLLEQREGLRLEAYHDTRGVLTIGYGHTSAAGSPSVYRGQKITKEEADSIFSNDLMQYEREVNLYVPYNVTANEYDALVSFCYNIGLGGFKHSEVVRWLTSVHSMTVPVAHKVANAMMEWDKPAELIGRRKEEMQQFLTPYSNAAPQS